MSSGLPRLGILCCALLVLACRSVESPEAAPRVVFMVAEREYGTAASLRAFFSQRLAPAGWQARFVEAPPEGPERDAFPGLPEALSDADLLVLSVRRRAPRTAELAAVRRHLEQGRPLLALRTSSHAFHLRGAQPPAGHASWETFDREVLGAAYEGHHPDEECAVRPAAAADGHLLLEGIGGFPSRKLYRFGAPVEEVQVLLEGETAGEETEPVAWVHAYGERRARVFSTSLGSREDFARTEFLQLLESACAWALEGPRASAGP